MDGTMGRQQQTNPNKKIISSAKKVNMINQTINVLYYVLYHITEGGFTPDVLQEVQVSLVGDAACRESYGEAGIDDSMLCARLQMEAKMHVMYVLRPL